ncbi:Beta-lactamase/transpeptidase-like protein [Metarhizium rileyi]|uniref:Beta-lactamase/transpeptidase-like protein n=1 Tax=Metarhizium rileyi (strain RCEF 4871) TaxID=1649241 RepID=A0A162LT50_METRR|nr:Beta-lactamase/transpeptidase-like protein [Metarhizium rileyi RCEF 4871]
MKLTRETQKKLGAAIDKAVDGEDAIPGTTVVFVSKDGSELFVKSAGKRGASTDEPMTPDSVFWTASCTKMLTALACMQLVEKGLLKLDDATQTEGFCPEWRNLKVLTPSGEMTEKKNGITLRMLLTHTAGFGYSFFNTRLRAWGYPAGINEFSGDMADIVQPLLFQPGEGWEYGVNVDWAGLVLERATGTSLNEYIQQNICKPLRLRHLSMFPTEEMKKNLAYMHQRAPNGKLSQREHLHRRPLTVTTAEQKEAILNSGGAGIFAKPQDYCRVLTVLLNDGTCPMTGAKLLEKSTIDEMFRNQIPQFPHFGRQGFPAAKPDLVNPVSDLYPSPGNPPQGWGLSFMLNGGQTGRSETTCWWAGISNLFWWADRENGVGGMVCSQILPFGDLNVLELWFEVESLVYQGLKTAVP